RNSSAIRGDRRRNVLVGAAAEVDGVTVRMDDVDLARDRRLAVGGEDDQRRRRRVARGRGERECRQRQQCEKPCPEHGVTAGGPANGALTILGLLRGFRGFGLGGLLGLRLARSVLLLLRVLRGTRLPAPLAPPPPAPPAAAAALLGRGEILRQRER